MRRHTRGHPSRALTLLILSAASPAAAQLAADWVIPAAAHTAGVGATYWRTDLSLHNPHVYELPVVVQLLASDTVNHDVPTLELTLAPWETVNLWDVLGPEVFDFRGTGAILAYAHPDLRCDPLASCHFLATSRTYTPDGGGGEYGLTVPGLGAARGCDWWTLAYAAGILNDGRFFRSNVGVASWTPAWTTVRLDVQDASGRILRSERFELPPFGHSQRRLTAPVEGGSLVFYLEAGPDEALVFPYATVINQETGDGSFFFAEASPVGVDVDKRDPERTRPPRPESSSSVAAAPGQRTSRAY